MAYTGTGTQNDPYVVDDWDSLIEKIADTEAYVTVADNVDIDLTKIYPEGLPTSQPILRIACKEFDGNDIILRNAYTLTSLGNSLICILSTCKACSGIQLVNFFVNVGTSQLLYYESASAFSSAISHCTFKGIMYANTNDHRLFNNIHRLYDCVINLKYINTYSISGRSCYNTVIFDSCWVRIDSNCKWRCSNGQQSFYNSYFEGKLKAVANNDEILNIGRSLVSIINVTIDAGEYTGCRIYSWSDSSTIIVNKDKLIGDVTLAQYGTVVPYTEVTNVQLKDLSYMEDIFPVVPYEGGNS